MSAGLPSDYSEEGLHLAFRNDTFFLFWDSEFARIGCRTHFNDEVGPGYSDPICMNWEREFVRIRRACRTGDPDRVAREIEDMRVLFCEYRRSVQNIRLGLASYLKTLESSKVPRAKLSSKDKQRYQTILKMLPSLDRRFGDLHTIANGILRGNMNSLVPVCCAAIRKASACMQSLTREARFN